MNAIDARMQPQDGQRRQHRHFEDAPANGYTPLPGTGNFLMSDAQDAFTFSAEPTAMAYDNSTMTLPSSSTPGHDSAFTPNLDSSFDSTLHPDMVSRSYPPLNAYSQGQNLSAGTYANLGPATSPSHSAEHLSPEPGYASDLNQQNPSNYTTPSFNSQYLDESFSNLNFTEDPTTTTAFPTYQADVDMSLLTSGSLNTYNAQPHMLPTNGTFFHQHQLMSPSITNTSSPAMGNDSSIFMATQFPDDGQSSFTPPSQISHLLHKIPRNPLQSPPLMNSPGHVSMASPRPLTRHMTSPIVRVENYSREESPSYSDNSRGFSRRSLSSRRSGNHLSPYPQNDSSDEEEESHEQLHVQAVYRETERNEDGSWLGTAGPGQAGLSPMDRQAMGDMLVPSLDEIAERRTKMEKKLEVQDWLTKSEVGSETGDFATSSSFLKPHTGRRRAKSQNDANRQALHGSFGLDVRSSFDTFNATNIPGPGRYIIEQSECGDDDEEEEEDNSSDSPPASVNMQADQTESSYFPATRESSSTTDAIVQPWMDVPVQPPATSSHYQPPTSNAAMMRFRQRAKDVESASLAATVGSRRLSEPDLASIRGSPGVVRRIEPEPRKSDDRQRRPNFLRNIRRTPSNLLKRKGSVPAQQTLDMASDQSKDLVFEKPKRIGSWGRPKSPRANTNLSDKSKDGVPSSSLGVSATSGPWYQGAKNVIKRSRSRSDIGRSRGDSGKSFGLAELMTQHGGPPMPMLASPLADTEGMKQSVHPGLGADEDDDDDQEAITMDLKVRTDPIIPNQEGFRTHARQLNPRLADFMVERIAQEQIRRYKRLLEFRVKHINVVQNRNCASGKFCTELGGEAKQLPPKAGNKDHDAPFLGFQITTPGEEEDDAELPPEGTVVAAQFPSGVPLPPVKRLPAEFECPLCFKVKKFFKPSDWTKHVHEDVQPFTCTFPNCQEPKSFKRKADWVRHENERHRQLENWTCNISDCNHTCYRKDNFVQHLVREHKIAEPKQRTGRGSNKDPPASSDAEDVWAVVERCRRDTTKQPKDEPCRFCGNICNSWKKLTVHLAKHMEQISMPILPLVEQKLLNADTIISPVQEFPDTRKLSAVFSRKPVPSPLQPSPNTTFGPGINPFRPHDPSEAAANVVHSYPPPQMVAPQQSGYAAYAANNMHYTNQTYPGTPNPPKTPMVYTNEFPLQDPSYVNMGPVSAIQQQEQAMFTNSPTETTAFPSYLAPDQQNMMGGRFDAAMQMQYQQQAATGTYQAMDYLTNQQQQNYQYQG
ncbi:metal ion binding [Ascochyta rabiei]|uniref:Metal ion binding n=1 Tax=Didymella rabiei TaxID=5454 RepID=A0A163JGZ5_DIDRA|nr:metal ion binding [Ascochyta rabiei]